MTELFITVIVPVAWKTTGWLFKRTALWRVLATHLSPQPWATTNQFKPLSCQSGWRTKWIPVTDKRCGSDGASLRRTHWTGTGSLENAPGSFPSTGCVVFELSTPLRQGERGDGIRWSPFWRKTVLEPHTPEIPAHQAQRLSAFLTITVNKECALKKKIFLPWSPGQKYKWKRIYRKSKYLEVM